MVDGSQVEQIQQAESSLRTTERKVGQVESQAQQILRKKLPERRFGAGVDVRKQQQQILSQKEKAREKLEEVRRTRQEIAEARGKIEEQKREIEQQEKLERAISKRRFDPDLDKKRQEIFELFITRGTRIRDKPELFALKQQQIAEKLGRAEDISISELPPDVVNLEPEQVEVKKTEPTFGKTAEGEIVGRNILGGQIIPRDDKKGRENLDKIIKFITPSDKTIDKLIEKGAFTSTTGLSDIFPSGIIKQPKFTGGDFLLGAGAVAGEELKEGLIVTSREPPLVEQVSPAFGVNVLDFRLKVDKDKKGEPKFGRRQDGSIIGSNILGGGSPDVRLTLDTSDTDLEIASREAGGFSQRVVAELVPTTKESILVTASFPFVVAGGSAVAPTLTKIALTSFGGVETGKAIFGKDLSGGTLTPEQRVATGLIGVGAIAGGIGIRGGSVSEFTILRRRVRSQFKKGEIDATRRDQLLTEINAVERVYGIKREIPPSKTLEQLVPKEGITKAQREFELEIFKEAKELFGGKSEEARLIRKSGDFDVFVEKLKFNLREKKKEAILRTFRPDELVTERFNRRTKTLDIISKEDPSRIVSLGKESIGFGTEKATDIKGLERKFDFPLAEKGVPFEGQLALTSFREQLARVLFATIGGKQKATPKSEGSLVLSLRRFIEQERVVVEGTKVPLLKEIRQQRLSKLETEFNIIVSDLPTIIKRIRASGKEVPELLKVKPIQDKTTTPFSDFLRSKRGQLGGLKFTKEELLGFERIPRRDKPLTITDAFTDTGFRRPSITTGGGSSTIPTSDLRFTNFPSGFLSFTGVVKPSLITESTIEVSELPPSKVKGSIIPPPPSPRTSTTGSGGGGSNIPPSQIPTTPPTSIITPSPPSDTPPSTTGGGTPPSVIPPTITPRRTPLSPKRTTTRRRRGKRKKDEDEFGFRTFVIKEGKKVFLEGIRPRGLAIRKGADVTSKTLRATFGIQRTKKKIKKPQAGFKPSELEFRTFRRRKGKKIPLQDTFIERRKFRLDTPSELKELAKAKGGIR